MNGDKHANPWGSVKSYLKRKYAPVWALNADTEKWRLWTPKLKSDEDGSERQYWEVMGMALEHRYWEMMGMALNADTEKWWLWTPNEDAMMALNAKTDEWWWLRTPRLEMSMALNADWEVMTALNAKLKIVMALNAKTRTPKPKSDDGSERQTGNATLNVKLKMWWWWL